MLDSGGFNKGLDIGVPVGTAFSFVAGGTVVHAGPSDDGWGISVKVRDADGVIHNYGHLSDVAVSVGDVVSVGQMGGKTGNSGASTGPHLSYDTYAMDGRGVDPSPYLGFNAIGDNRNPAGSIIGRDVSEVGSGGPSVEDSQYWEKRRRYNALSSQYGLWLEDPDLARQLKIPQPDPSIIQEMMALDAELADYEDTYGAGGVSVTDIKNAYDIFNQSDPRAIDAENAAAKYNREYGTRYDAAQLGQDAVKDQLAHVKEATDSQQAFIDSAAGGAPRLAGAVALPAKLKSGDELYQESLDRLTKNLPAVPDMPYQLRPAGGPEDVLRRGSKTGAPPYVAPKPFDMSQSASNTVAESDTAAAGYTAGLPSRDNFSSSAGGMSSAGSPPQPIISSFGAATQNNGSAETLRGSIFDKIRKPSQLLQGTWQSRLLR